MSFSSGKGEQDQYKDTNTFWILTFVRDPSGFDDLHRGVLSSGVLRGVGLSKKCLSIAHRCPEEVGRSIECRGDVKQMHTPTSGQNRLNARLLLSLHPLVRFCLGNPILDSGRFQHSSMRDVGKSGIASPQPYSLQPLCYIASDTSPWLPHLPTLRLSRYAYPPSSGETSSDASSS